MANIEIEIEGAGAVAATEELLQIEGLNATYEVEGEQSKEAVLATIATVVGITAGTIEISKAIYEVVQKYKAKKAEERIEKALLIGRNGQRILLLNATLEQILKILNS